MEEITVNKTKYIYEIEGVFDTEYALKITLIHRYTYDSGYEGTVIHRGIYPSRPDEKYIEYLIEQVQKTR